MSKKDTYEARFEEILVPIASQYGVEIYDVEFVKEAGDYFLRAYIDKEGGVTIDDCENVSRAVSDVMDQDDFIEEAYTLEISSPGLGRTLKKDKHLQKSIGEQVELKCYKPIDGQKEFSGRLVTFDKDSVTLQDENGQETTFARADLAQIKLALDF